MTKAVGDLLGTNGIADEMIRFNGFPFLEKEDHAYNVSSASCCYGLSLSDVFVVSAVMRNELHVLTETGMQVKDVGKCLRSYRSVIADGIETPEAILAATDVKGFPIVSADGFRTLIGYIGRAELQFILGA